MYSSGSSSSSSSWKHNENTTKIKNYKNKSTTHSLSTYLWTSSPNRQKLSTKKVPRIHRYPSHPYMRFYVTNNDADQLVWKAYSITAADKQWMYWQKQKCLTDRQMYILPPMIPHGCMRGRTDVWGYVWMPSMYKQKARHTEICDNPPPTYLPTTPKRNSNM